MLRRRRNLHRLAAGTFDGLQAPSSEAWRFDGDERVDWALSPLPRARLRASRPPAVMTISSGDTSAPPRRYRCAICLRSMRLPGGKSSTVLQGSRCCATDARWRPSCRKGNSSGGGGGAEGLRGSQRYTVALPRRLQDLEDELTYVDPFGTAGFGRRRGHCRSACHEEPRASSRFQQPPGFQQLVGPDDARRTGRALSTQRANRRSACAGTKRSVPNQGLKVLC